MGTRDGGRPTSVSVSSTGAYRDITVWTSRAGDRMVNYRTAISTVCVMLIYAPEPLRRHIRKELGHGPA